MFFTLIPVLALLSNYDQENCLINVGTEGTFRPMNKARVPALLTKTRAKLDGAANNPKWIWLPSFVEWPGTCYEGSWRSAFK